VALSCVPTMAINDVSVTEGNSGMVSAVFHVTLSMASDRTVSAGYATANGTAAAPGDYVATSGTVSFAPGQTSKTISVTVNGDTGNELNETFTVNLSSPVNATLADGQGVGTIVNDDPPAITITDATVGEGGTADAVFTVTLSNPHGQQVTVNYATADGTALSTTDYVPVSGALTFTAGQTSKTITVPLRRDDLPELGEALFVNLSAPANGVLADAQGMGTITDDDTGSYSFYGSADSTTVPGCFTMADTYFEKGAVYPTKPFSLASKFDMTFKVGFGKYDADGGGGLVWLLTPAHSLGDNDMGYGYIPTSVGVEMDTLQNYNIDPEYDHIAVDQNGGTAAHAGFPAVQASATSANIEDNARHELRITRDPAAARLDVYFDGSLRLNYYKDIVGQIFGGNPTVYWGFTGANNCNSTVCPSNHLYWCPVAVCIGDTATPRLLVDDVEVSEGNAGNATATFTVRMYCPRSQTVTVNYATANGTAASGSDYTAGSGTLTFSPGETQKTVSVTVVQDAVSEADETILLNLSNQSVNVALPDSQAVATIVDDVRFAFGQAGDVPLSGDWNGDGIDTPGVWRAGTFYLRNSNTPGPADIQFTFGAAGDVPLVGDWNGDGIDTVGIWNGAFFYLKTANTAAASFLSFSYGQAGDIPLAGDWNGDGIDTIGVRRGASFLLRNSNAYGAADISYTYGLATDVPVMGDWNNDNLDTPGVFRDGTFYLRNSNTSGNGEVTVVYGNVGDQPLAGDRDGDGDDTVGVWRNGTFRVRK
jgi:large repetitive protein